MQCPNLASALLVSRRDVVVRYRARAGNCLNRRSNCIVTGVQLDFLKRSTVEENIYIFISPINSSRKL